MNRMKREDMERKERENMQKEDIDANKDKR